MTIDLFRPKNLPAVLGALALAACSRAPAAPPAAAQTGAESGPLREVETAKAELVPWERTIEAVGSLAAFEQATVGAKVPGRLAEITVDLGSEIHAGQVIARIERRDYELALSRSQAALGAARAALGLPAEGEDDRVEPEETAAVKQARAVLAETSAARARVVALRGQGVSSQAEEDVAESAFRVAESRLQTALEDVATRRATLVQRRTELAIARAALDDTEIKAPFDGAVLERLAGTGDFLSAGNPIARVARLDPLRLRLEIPERESALVEVGQPVRLQLESEHEPRPGRIARISPAVGARNRALVVEAEIENPPALRLAEGAREVASSADGANHPAGGALPVTDGSLHPADGGITDGHASDASAGLARAHAPSAGSGLRPGAFARAEIVIDPHAQTLSVPISAVRSFAGIDKLIVIENGKAVEKRVTLGRRDERRVEVLDGLAPGAEVVLMPGNLQTGTPVRPAH
jgi:multidrug efflux pump subunit AcrA (membrane-fusion protein)